MLKLNQKGFSVVFIVLIILVLSVGGFVAWRVSKTNIDVPESTITKQDKKEETKEPTEAKEKTVPDGWVSYESEGLGFSFAYPKEWSLKEEPNVYFHAADANSVVLESPDYATAETPIGGEGIKTGQIITVYYQSTKQSDVAEDVKYMQGPCAQPGVVTYTQVTVDNTEALQFECNWEGDGELEVGLVSNGYRYFLTFNAADTDATTTEPASQYYSTFEQFLKNFSLPQ